MKGGSVMAWVILAVVVVIALGVTAWLLVRIRRTQRLQRRFGSEYRRTVDEQGNPSAAEAELRRRESRRKQFVIRPLSAESKVRYVGRWKEAQALFVDEPGPAVALADRLIGDAMRERGYPVEDFDQRASDLSVDYPQVVEEYRIGHDIATRNTGGEAETEELRQAMVHYRSLFEQLVEKTPTEVGR